MTSIAEKLMEIVHKNNGSDGKSTVTERLQAITQKASSFLNGSITVDQSNPNDVQTTVQPSFLGGAVKAAAGFVTNPVRGAAYLGASAIDSITPQKTEEEKMVRQEEIDRKEVEGQIEVNRKLGNESDALGNIIKKEQPKEAVQPEADILSEQAKSNFDVENFRKGIVYNEVRGAIGAGLNPYEVVGRTGDLGKYQVSPDSLESWSKIWLGKKYTPEEFKKDPQAQESFFGQFIKVAERLKLSPEQAAIAWHRGWGLLGIGEKGVERDQAFIQNLNAKMDEEISQKYLKSFKEGTSTPD